jgi:hypothetical protein
LAGTYRTPDGLTSAVMQQLGKEWDDWTAHDDTCIVDGENVVVLARYRSRPCRSSCACWLLENVGSSWRVRGYASSAH